MGDGSSIHVAVVGIIAGVGDKSTLLKQCCEAADAHGCGVGVSGESQRIYLVLSLFLCLVVWWKELCLLPLSLVNDAWSSIL